MNKKVYTKPAMDTVLVAPQQFNLPSSVPGGFPGLAGIKEDPFDGTEEQIESELKTPLW